MSAGTMLRLNPQKIASLRGGFSANGYSLRAYHNLTGRYAHAYYPLSVGDSHKTSAILGQINSVIGIDRSLLPKLPYYVESMGGMSTRLPLMDNQ